MDFGGDGGFQPYGRLPQPNSGMQAPEISTGLPGEMNQPINISSGDEDECSVREPNCFMPMASIVRIMRKILPANAKISDNCKETMQECVSEFIRLVTSEANLHCQEDRRSTVTAEDMLWAMSKLGFYDYIEPLAMYLNRLRESDTGVLESSSSEPSTERAADPTADPVHNLIQTSVLTFVAYQPAIFAIAPAPGPANGFMNNPSGADAGPSQRAEDNLDPFGQAKELEKEKDANAK